MPFFSVIIPTYNRAVFLKKAIKSVLDQEYTDWELLIIDDGSTDNTSELVKSFHDPRVRYIFQQNAERSVARNNGIANANGKYICFLDSDDYYMPNCLFTFYSEIILQNQPEAMFVVNIYEDTNGILKQKDIFNNKFIDNPIHYYWENTVLAPISVCIHHKILSEHKFNPEFNVWEDSHLWFRILSIYPFYYIPAYVAVSVRHQLSGNNMDVINIKVEKADKYIAAINHLFNNYDSILKNLTNKMRIDYINNKYHLYLYCARNNRQYKVAFQIIFRVLKNKLSLYNLLTFIKLIIYCIIYPRKRKIFYHN